MVGGVFQGGVELDLQTNQQYECSQVHDTNYVVIRTKALDNTLKWEQLLQKFLLKKTLFLSSLILRPTKPFSFTGKIVRELNLNLWGNATSIYRMLVWTDNGN